MIPTLPLSPPPDDDRAGVADDAFLAHVDDDALVRALTTVHWRAQDVRQFLRTTTPA